MISTQVWTTRRSRPSPSAEGRGRESTENRPGPGRGPHGAVPSGSFEVSSVGQDLAPLAKSRAEEGRIRFWHQQLAVWKSNFGRPTLDAPPALPRWRGRFSTQCRPRDRVGFDAVSRRSTQYFPHRQWAVSLDANVASPLLKARLEDVSRGELMGHALINLTSLLDRKIHRGWHKLVGEATDVNETVTVELGGEVELIVQWCHSPVQKAEVVPPTTPKPAKPSPSGISAGISGSTQKKVFFGVAAAGGRGAGARARRARPRAPCPSSPRSRKMRRRPSRPRRRRTRPRWIWWRIIPM